MRRDLLQSTIAHLLFGAASFDMALDKAIQTPKDSWEAGPIRQIVLNHCQEFGYLTIREAEAAGVLVPLLVALDGKSMFAANDNREA